MSDTLIGALVAGLVSLAGYYLVFKVNRRTATTDAAQRQIDQFQEDRSADREQFEKAAARFELRQGRLETRIELMEARERTFSDYVLTLRWHIAEGQPPPPPPFPAELLKPLEPGR
jgi:outer membrane murein-binding lipoprotein Lpp